MEKRKILLTEIQEIKQRAEKEILKVIQGVELSTECIVSDIDVLVLSRENENNSLAVNISLLIKDKEEPLDL